MSQIIKKLIKELRRLEKHPNSTKDYARFHKDKSVAVSIATPILRKLSAEYHAKIKALGKDEILKLAEELLSSGVSGNRTIAFDWAFRIKKEHRKEDFKILESWLKKYVKSWASCDDLCTHAFGHLIWQYPELILQVRPWIKSKNMWFRRASAVIMIYPGRRSENLDFAFEVAVKLMLDKEDLVQKGYGWLLKEVSNTQEKRVFDFVIKHKNRMSRTALRYAIEKMPLKLKKQAML